MRKVLLINRKTEIVDKVNQLKEELERDSDLQVKTASYADINLLLDGEDSFARIDRIGMDLADFDKVVCITTAPFEHLYVFSAFGCYCRKKGVDMMDNVFPNTRGKLYEMWRLWENDIPVPKTAYGTSVFLGECLVRSFNNIGVLKAINGTNGHDNHFVAHNVGIIVLCFVVPPFHHTARIVQHHLIVDDITEHLFAAFNTNGDEIQSRRAVIIPFQPDRMAMVFVGVVLGHGLSCFYISPLNAFLSKACFRSSQRLRVFS